MLTEAQNFIIDPEGGIKATADVYLHGKEINGETYAICKSDMMIKGNNPENIRFGSTLATDEFSSTRFDFMLSNPPYGKSWKTEQKRIIDNNDPRFKVKLKAFDASHADNLSATVSHEAATPRSSDGQLLFLMEMVSKIKPLSQSPNGSRIASVHNGSALFTGDAGSGESNIRRFLIENDLLEAIIQLPNNLFYNTGITTYIWVLSNNKVPARRGKVQLIDASNAYRKLRKNLGQKNCEFSPDDIKQITNDYLSFKAVDNCKVFDNADFGYYKVTIERPLRLKAQFTAERVASLRFASVFAEEMRWVYEQLGDKVYSELATHQQMIEDYLEQEAVEINAKNKQLLFNQTFWLAQRELMRVAEQLQASIGDEEFNDFNVFVEQIAAAVKAGDYKSPFQTDKKLQAGELKQIINALSWRDEAAEKVIKKQHKLTAKQREVLCHSLGTTEACLADYGYFANEQTGQFVEYESDAELRDYENIPLKEAIDGYFLREVRPHVADAWMAIEQSKIGYEISFNKYFYQHQPLRSLADVTADILALESETEGLLKKLVNLTAAEG
jgi:type I restriction enzyme M protein